jgi:hypothetical membrane protein
VKNWVRKPAVIAAVVGPIQTWLGWLIAGSMWPGYDPVRQTISDLAANESPVKGLMSSFFIVGGTLSIIVAIFAPVLAMPGRIAIAVSGVATYGLTIFSTPLVGYSTPHRVFAITSFVLSSAWPLLSMRFGKQYPAIIRPKGAITATVILTVVSLWFLATWTDPTATFVGVAERLLAVGQTWYLAVVLWVCWYHGRNRTSA